MAAEFHCILHLAHVGVPIGGLGQEVEDGAVVPDVAVLLGQRDGCDVAQKPRHRVRAPGEPVAGDVDGALGDVEHAEAAVSPIEQVIDQRRFTGADVDDASVALSGRGGDEF